MPCLDSITVLHYTPCTENTHHPSSYRYRFILQNIYRTYCLGFDLYLLITNKVMGISVLPTALVAEHQYSPLSTIPSVPCTIRLDQPFSCWKTYFLRLLSTLCFVLLYQMMSVTAGECLVSLHMSWASLPSTTDTKLCWDVKAGASKEDRHIDI